MPSLRPTAHRPSRRGAAVALAAWLLAAAHGPAGQEDPRLERARLLAENEALRKEVELASSKDFYLVLDVDRRIIQLGIQGVTVREYPVLDIRILEPRRPLGEDLAPEEWPRRLWSGGRLDPPRDEDRMEIQPPDPSAPGGTEPEPPIPPTPEEKNPLPPRYFVRYDGGLALEVRPDAPSETATLATRLGGALVAWGRRVTELWSERDLGRIRVVLTRDDAGALYRALPPETRLLVLVDGAV